MSSLLWIKNGHVIDPAHGRDGVETRLKVAHRDV